MAKDSDQSAGTFAAEKAGEGLAGILAEENVFDRRALWRIGTWGVAAVAAVVVAVMANQASLGLRRDRLAAGDLSRQAQQLQAIARESQDETRRLAAAIDTLNNDRDRLFSRVTVLEHGLDSVTGAIARQNSPGAAAAPAPLPALPKVSPAAGAPPNPGNSAESQPASASQSPHPAIALVMGIAPAPAPPPAASDRPRGDPARPEPKPELKSAKAEVKSEPKAEAKPDSKQEPRLDAKLDAKSDPKSDAKPESKPEAKLEQAIAPAPSPSPAASKTAANAPTAVGTLPPTGSHALTMAVASLSMIGPSDPTAAKFIEPPNAANPASHAGMSQAPVTEAMASVSSKESDQGQRAAGGHRTAGTANRVRGRSRHGQFRDGLACSLAGALEVKCGAFRAAPDHHRQGRQYRVRHATQACRRPAARRRFCRKNLRCADREPARLRNDGIRWPAVGDVGRRSCATGGQKCCPCCRRQAISLQAERAEARRRQPRYPD